MKKNKPTKKVAKKATVKKQPAKKVAPKKKEAMKVKVLTFEPDEVLQLKEHIEALKDVIKSQKETTTKLRKRNKALSDQVAELKQNIASKNADDFLRGVDTGLGKSVLPTRVVVPSSPFGGDTAGAPAVTPTTTQETPKVDVTPAVTWSKENPFAPVTPPTVQKGLLGNVCAVKY